MMCPCWFTDCSKRTVLLGDVGNGQAARLSLCKDGEQMGSAVPFSPFFSEPITTLKKKSQKKKKK